MKNIFVALVLLGSVLTGASLANAAVNCCPQSACCGQAADCCQ